MNINTKPYKGTRDYYPEDKRLQNYIFSTWRKVAESHGYEEYGAPILEPLSIYAAKSGADLVNDETYRFIDRGNREVAIRPEMTPSVTRMVAARVQETAYPARWYSIANFMRYERPQSGREREFWQLNIDMFGVEGVEADIEIIALSDKILKAFNATEEMYSIKVNHRQLVDFIMKQYLSLNDEEASKLTKLFDKKSKISSEDFDHQAGEAIGGNANCRFGLEEIKQLFETESFQDLPEEIRLSHPCDELKLVLDSLKNYQVNNAKLDLCLMRGLDYYNGIVFEVFDNHLENKRSIFGGGRYDGMTSMFGAQSIPVAGFAPGATTTELFLRSHSLLPELSSKTDLYIAVLGKEYLIDAENLANKLRACNVNVEVDITNRKIDKQLKTANKKSILKVLFIGKDEVEASVYKLKDMTTGNEQMLGADDLAVNI